MGAPNLIPSNLDWVTARAECSVVHVFKEIEQGVIADVEKAQSFVLPTEPIKFSIAKGASNRFTVVRVDDPISAISHSVYFVCKRGEIQVYEDAANGEELRMKATLTLTDDGHCKLKVGDEELYQWQFRRRALENLFFGIPR